eukprot:Seg459.1 transcript_id=Seg459.1/GoldUCD/mRNA.D3Y31 product="hypothetical protein" protein_id=Seg459.1/GoldUCD/D3Y31
MKDCGLTSSGAIKRIVMRVYAFCNEDVFKHWLKLCFEKDTLNEGEISLGASILKAVFEKIISVLADRIREVDALTCSNFDVGYMDSVGLGKVCYVGGWVISIIMSNSKRKFCSSLNSVTEEATRKAGLHYERAKALRSCCIIPYDILKKTTKYPPTLKVTEENQYRSQGLIRITDECYKFFLQLEQQRVKFMSPCIYNQS